MLPRGEGRIVNLALFAGRLAVPGQATYAASKAAVIAVTEGVAWEYEGSGVTIGAVFLSFTDTELIAGTGTPRSAKAISAAEVAEAVVASLCDGALHRYVPRSVRPTGALIGALPLRAQRSIHRPAGDGPIFLDARPRGSAGLSGAHRPADRRGERRYDVTATQAPD